MGPSGYKHNEQSYNICLKAMTSASKATNNLLPGAHSEQTDGLSGCDISE